MCDDYYEVFNFKEFAERWFRMTVSGEIRSKFAEDIIYIIEVQVQG